jgi:ATP-dependent DNA ligase
VAGNDLTKRFSLIVDAVAGLRARSAILDGEALTCGDDGVPSFDRIRYRGSSWPSTPMSLIES